MMIDSLVIAIVAAPLVALVGCLVFRHPRISEALNLIAGVIALGCALPLPFLLDGHAVMFWGDYVIVDRTARMGRAVYGDRLLCSPRSMRSAICGSSRRTDRLFSFYALFAGFGLTTLVGPFMNSIGIYWIAIELTTLVSTFLVAFERVAESMEAAWKYIMVVSAGISLALLGTILFYWARYLRSRSNLQNDMGGTECGGTAHESDSAVAGVSAGIGGVWHQGRDWRRCTHGYPTRTAKRPRRFPRCFPERY